MDIRNALIYIKHQATRGRNKPRLKKELLVDLEIIEKHATEALIEAEKKCIACGHKLPLSYFETNKIDKCYMCLTDK